MTEGNNQLRAEGRLLAKTPFFWAHLAVPALGILVFLGYMCITPHAAENLTVHYFQGLALVYPIVAAWVSSLATEPEMEAGGGFFLLSARSRGKALLAKLAYLLVFGLFACLLVTVGYGSLAGLVRPEYAPPLSMLFGAGFILWGCAAFQYAFHTWLGLRFGRNVSLAVAAAQLLVSSLMLTGLGEAIWYFIPCAWGPRLLGLYVRPGAGGTLTSFDPAVLSGSIATAATLAMLVFLFAWLRRWEGRKAEE